ncbi:MAG: VOC family protein [Pseudomonadota bacterium]
MTVHLILWFDTQAEQAVHFYTGIFPNSKIGAILRYGKAGQEIHRMPEGAVMVVAFELDGQTFTALNGGPAFTFNEAISFQVNCGSQEEIDFFWEKLAAGGATQAQQCGWLKDRYGASWQIVPVLLPQLLADPDPEKSQRTMQALLKMKKIDLDQLKRAHAGHL